MILIVVLSANNVHGILQRTVQVLIPNSFQCKIGQRETVSTGRSKDKKMCCILKWDLKKKRHCVDVGGGNRGQSRRRGVVS